MGEPDKEEILSRIKGTVDLDMAADCDLVVEAAVENLEIKKDIFKDLDQIPNT